MGAIFQKYPLGRKLTSCRGMSASILPSSIRCMSPRHPPPRVCGTTARRRLASFMAAANPGSRFAARLMVLWSMPRQGAASRRDIPREIRSQSVRCIPGVSRGGWPGPDRLERVVFFLLLKYSRVRLPQAPAGQRVAATSPAPFATPLSPEVGFVAALAAVCGQSVFSCSECVMTLLLTNSYTPLLDACRELYRSTLGTVKCHQTRIREIVFAGVGSLWHQKTSHTERLRGQRLPTPSGGIAKDHAPLTLLGPVSIRDHQVASGAKSGGRESLAAMVNEDR